MFATQNAGVCQAVLSMVAAASIGSAASAQITAFSDRQMWLAATGGSGQTVCEDLEKAQTGSFPLNYVSPNNWQFAAQGQPVSFDIVTPGSLNGTTQIQFRTGDVGVALKPPCQPCSAFGFDYQTFGAPWTVAVDGQSYNLLPNGTGFFGVVSSNPIAQIKIFSPGPQIALIAMDNLCCVEGGGGGTGTPECESVAGECCAGRPHFNVPAYAGFGSLVTIGTASPSAVGSAVVAVFDIANPNAGPFNTDFGAPIFTQPSWSETNLGSVFGVTLDPTGNIYVTGTTCYGVDQVGTLGGSLGAVYKIDGSTGVASVFKLLPNANNTGLGNICYDCQHDQFFVSNMEDGIIYRLDQTGAVLSTFDFGTPDDPTNAFPPLGDRVWAVQAHNNRLYFSVWNEDNGNPSTTMANEIWSIALDGTGNFSGTPQLEITMPPMGATNMSPPVADIRFTPSGSMLVAERGMGDATNPVPHQSRLLEFECVNHVWTPSANAYSVGVISGENSAGGVDMDYSTGGRVYVTSDAMQLGPQQIYGTQGLPATGGSVANSVLIDFNGNLTVQDKTMIGDVAVPCPVEVPPCMEVTNQKISCPVSGTGCYTWTMTITNHSGYSVKYVTIPLHPSPGSPITINPNVINLNVQDGSLLDDGESTNITLTICGGNPGDQFCLQLGLVTPTFTQCCFKKVCIELPVCDCGQLRDQEITNVSCPQPGLVSFTFNFTLDNLSSFAADWVIFIPFKDEQATFAKDFFFLPPLAPNTSFPMSVDIMGAQPGEQFCFYVLMQHPGKFVLDCCCGFEKCITVPECQPGPPQSCAADINADGTVNVSDLLTVINNWGAVHAPCPPGSVADVTHDCVVNVSDLLAVINAWGNCP